MSGRFRRLAKVVTILALSSPAYSQFTSSAVAKAQLTVYVHNRAAAPAPTISRAQSGAGRAFLSAGIDLQWVDCGLAAALCQGDPASPSVKVTILPKSRVNDPGLLPAAFGLTLPTGVLVFSDKTRDLAESYRFSESQIMAMVLAHELGHALLGPGHAATGLMLGNLRAQEMRSFADGQLRFTAKQAEIMRALLTLCHSGVRQSEQARTHHLTCR